MITTTKSISNEPPVTDEERQRLQQVMDYLRKDAVKGPTLAMTANAFAVSPFHLHRRFHLAFGVTPKAVVTGIQMEEAKRLLLAGEKILSISDACGFSNQSHFTSRFRQVVGSSPAKWLKAQRASRGGVR